MRAIASARVRGATPRVSRVAKAVDDLRSACQHQQGHGPHRKGQIVSGSGMPSNTHDIPTGSDPQGM
jgi:hypothetical protein